MSAIVPFKAIATALQLDNVSYVKLWHDTRELFAMTCTVDCFEVTTRQLRYFLRPVFGRLCSNPFLRNVGVGDYIVVGCSSVYGVMDCYPVCYEKFSTLRDAINYVCTLSMQDVSRLYWPTPTTIMYDYEIWHVVDYSLDYEDLLAVVSDNPDTNAARYAQYDLESLYLRDRVVM